MLIFANRAAQNSIKNIPLSQGTSIIHIFPDGEISVQIPTDQVIRQHIWVIASTQPPAENIIELFLLLDALQSLRGSIYLFMLYDGYARHGGKKQCHTYPQETRKDFLIHRMLKNFSLAKTLIMHPHALALQDQSHSDQTPLADISPHNNLSFSPVYDVGFFHEQVQEYDAIAAPDQGALPFAYAIAKQCNKPLIALTKQRLNDNAVDIIAINGTTPHNKKILIIDDMISTGNTIIAAANRLKRAGATSITAMATHGIFAPGARERLEESILERIYVTNTVAQQDSPTESKIVVVDRSAVWAKIIEGHSW